MSGPGPGQGIAITTRYFPLSWAFALVKPKVVLNGYEMPVPAWGRVVYPTWPGPYHVQVWVPYLLPPRVGPAAESVIVHPGQLVELEYRLPVWTFSRGALGPAPQPYRGVWIVITGAVLALVFAVVFLLAILAGV
ncbi:MAG: hypothetical protein SW019_00095 [Actinomycetota bacterium]|nr:hypothetical protein [Actinomycetota bacterium]